MGDRKYFFESSVNEQAHDARFGRRYRRWNTGRAITKTLRLPHRPYRKRTGTLHKTLEMCALPKRGIGNRRYRTRCRQPRRAANPKDNGWPRPRLSLNEIVVLVGMDFPTV